MREHPYLIQLKLPSDETMFGKWSEGREILAPSDKIAKREGVAYFNEQKRLKQEFVGFRVLKLIFRSGLKLADRV